MQDDINTTGKTSQKSARQRIPEGIKQFTSGYPFHSGGGVRRGRITRKKKRVVKKKRLVDKKKRVTKKNGVYSRRIL